MITLYAFGPGFGLPDPSPFVTKVMVLLKMAGLPFETDTKGFRKAPRGKLPYIRDGDEIIADSNLIRFHLEKRYKIDFDRGLTPLQRSIAWSAEKMCEDHLYWLIVQERWLDGDNFERGPAHFFEGLPAPVRPLIKTMIRRRIRSTLHGQGIGRYTQEERAMLAGRVFASLSGIMGDKPYLMGENPCGADATVYSFILGSLCPLFESGARAQAQAYPNLCAYSERLTQQFFPSGVASELSR